MKKSLLALLLVGCLAATAAAADGPDFTVASTEKQDAPALWADLAQTKPLMLASQETGGQIVEEWYSSKTRFSVSAFMRFSFPSSTQVTTDGLWYSDFFDWGWGGSAEADLIFFVNPQWGVGPYLSVGADRFYGNRLNFFNGDFVEVGDMDMVTAIIGVKFVQKLSPYVSWDGHLGGGIVHYDRVTWSGVDSGLPFANEELFRQINRGVFEFAGRLCVGGRHIMADFGFGLRYMGGAARGADVSNFIDPDIFITFMLELGLTISF